jgi:hypothetical protein
VLSSGIFPILTFYREEQEAILSIYCFRSIFIGKEKKAGIG